MDKFGIENTGGSSAFSNGLTICRKIMVDLLVLGMLVILLAFTIREALNDSVILEEIGLPKALVDRGFSGDVVSMRLWDAIDGIYNETISRTDLNKKTIARTDLYKKTSFQLSSHQMEIVEPETGISFRSLAQMIGSTLGLSQRRIGGEFICLDSGCTKVELRLRYFHKGGFRKATAGPFQEVPETPALDAYFTSSALELLEIVDPMVVAEHLNGLDNRRAEKIARIIAKTDPGNDGRASALLGQIYSMSNKPAEAERWLRRSVEVSSDEEIWMAGTAYYLWGEDLLYRGLGAEAREKYIQAIDSFTQAAASEVKESGVYFYWAASLTMVERFDEANEIYKMSTDAEWDVASTHYWWGFNLAHLNDHPAAIAEFENAIEIDPKFELAYLDLGYSLGKANRQAEAIEQYSKGYAINADSRLGSDWIDAVAYEIAGDPSRECEAFARYYPALESAMKDREALARFDEINARCPL